MECIKDVKKLFLKAFLASQILDIVNQQQFKPEAFLAELAKLVVLDHINKYASELFA